jgi:HEAT repeats
MLGLKNLRGERDKVADVVARARILPAGDQRRWEAIAELDAIGIKTVFETAAELIETGDRDSVVLGAEILDGMFTGRYVAAQRFASAAERLVDPLCAPDQDPLVLATALHAYTILFARNGPLLLDLIKHSDARVRACACQLIAVEQLEAPEDRIVEALIEALAHDPNEDVRGQAAGGLLLLYSNDESCKPQIAGVLDRYRNDALPAVRVAAIQATSNDDAERMLARLTAELRDPAADWRFVQACDGRGFWESASDGTRSGAARALTRLREQNWAARETPGQYPLVHQREELLAAAIEAVTP